MGIGGALLLGRAACRHSYLKRVEKLKPFSDHASFLAWRDATVADFPLSSYREQDFGTVYRLLRKLESGSADSRLPWGGIILEPGKKVFRRHGARSFLVLDARGYLTFRKYPEALFEVQTGYGLLVVQQPKEQKRKVQLLSRHDVQKFGGYSGHWKLPEGSSYAIIALTPLMLEVFERGSLIFGEAVEETASVAKRHSAP